MPTTEELGKAFNAFDADKSGSISAAELVAILTRAGGGQPMTVADAEALIAEVDLNGDGELQLEEFCTLMGRPGALSLLPHPAIDEAGRLAAFEAATGSVKKSSPVLALFKQVAARDPSLTELMLSSSTNSLNVEFTMWPDKRKVRRVDEPPPADAHSHHNAIASHACAARRRRPWPC